MEKNEKETKKQTVKRKTPNKNTSKTTTKKTVTKKEAKKTTSKPQKTVSKKVTGVKKEKLASDTKEKEVGLTNNVEIKEEKVLETKEVVKDKPEEEKNKKKKYLILLLLFLFGFIFGISITFGKDFLENLSDQVIEVLNLRKPTAPKITGGSEEWAKERLIWVEKDSEAQDGLAYYEYCVRKEKSTENCNWQVTKTKNAKITTSGIYYVTFRGVDEEGKRGYKSNTEMVYIDNSNPIINNIKIKDTKSDSISIEVNAKDDESGIKEYQYSLDGKNYEKGKLNYTYNNLKPNKKYTIYVKVLDNTGNVSTLSMEVKTDDKTSDNKCELNCDKDNDGKCDLNCDTNNDGKCDTKCDTNNDGICDINCNNNDNNDNQDNDQKPGENDKPGDSENDDSTDDDNENDNDDGKEPEVKPTPTPTPTPGEGDNDDDNKDDEEEIIEIPVINLDKVPTEFVYGDKYNLPSYVDFKTDTGTYECIVAGKEYKDTSTLPIGKHLIVCTATSSKNIKVMVEKEVEVKVKEGEEEVWDGWIRLNLAYPDNSTNWEWRIGQEGEIRTGYDNTDWQSYTGPILVKLEDVDDVYIRYDLNSEKSIVSPSGKVAVDIIPTSYTLKNGEKTQVIIDYDKDSKNKQYRIDNGAWQNYKGTFEVSANQVIEARATKEEKIYDSEGNYVYTSKRTGTDSVFISEYVEETLEGGTVGSGTTSGGIAYESTITTNGTTVTAPVLGSKPTTYLEGPTITSNPSTELVESVKIKVTPEKVAEKIFISVGNGKYQEYTNPVEVTANGVVKAYYIRYSDGKVSETSYYYVQNIKEPELPYVKIDANPTNYLSETQDSVEVEISGSDYDTLEYSLDGVMYSTYSRSFRVNQSSTVYARGTNENGTKVETLMIPTTTAPVEKETLTVHIELDPDKNEIQGLVNKTTVEINYDSKAENKYYKLSYYGQWQEYTGPFEVKENTTVYAYCTSENGKGEASRSISFLTTGISSPIITATPTTSTQQVKIEIDYDDKANVTRYQIGNSQILEYNGPFYVYENTTIKAFNSNVLGYEAESSYEVTNIMDTPRYTAVDKGKYYIVKLSYPPTSLKEDREYKWKQDGIWKTYNEQGILLIKPEFKDEIMTDDADGLKVEDENGNEIVFTDHYYLIDVPFSELNENIFMRWGNDTVPAPTINLSTTEPTQEVEVGILYQAGLVKKYYKTVSEDGTDSGWLEYNGPFTVTENNVIIYAKGKTINNTDSKVSSLKITNVDLILPGINIVGDLETPKQQVTLNVTAIDNMGIDAVMWVKGDQDIEYIKENGIGVANNGTFKVTENGFYTVYASDLAGNEATMAVEVTNVDKNAPNIIINVLTESYGIETEVNIDYGDSIDKYYKIGETTETYEPYTENIIIKSNDVLDLVNEDGSITIYAKGTDEAGNGQEVFEKVYVLDLDAPAEPIIYSTAGYPILTEYGVVLGQDNYIVFDQTRNDIVNYYSVNNGETWKIYNGPFELESGTILAKSIKKTSGLTIQTSKVVEMPTDALEPEAYDGKEDTYHGEETKGEDSYKYIYISEELIGETIIVKGTHDYSLNIYAYFYDEQGKVLSSKIVLPIGSTTMTETELTVPKDTVKLGINYKTSGAHFNQYTRIHEIYPSTKPIITEISADYLPILTQNGIEEGYSEIKIDYFQTSTKKLYSIDEGLTWQEYKNQIIKVKDEETVQAKGIDKNGVETEIVTYEGKAPADIIGSNAYDGNDKTAYTLQQTTRVLKVASDMANRSYSMTFTITANTDHVNNIFYLSYIDENGTELGVDKVTKSVTKVTNTYTIPKGTTQIKIKALAGWVQYIYEIKSLNNPIFSSEITYPVLTESGIKANNSVIIDYHKTSVKKLYSVDNGTTWQEYQYNPVNINAGQKLLAKGIDKDGNESLIGTYIGTVLDGYLSENAYDGNEATYVSSPGKSNGYSSTMATIDKKLYVDNSMIEKNIYITGATPSGNIASSIKINFYDKEMNNIKTQSYSSSKPLVTIPANTDYIIFTLSDGGQYATGYTSKIYELEVSGTPVIIQNNIYSNLSLNSSKESEIEININYLSHLTEKLYSLDNGTTWQEYENSFTAKSGDVIKAKGIDKDGIETDVTTYTVVANSDNLGSNAFDNNKEQVAKINANSNGIFTLSEDTYGKDIRFFFSGTISSTATIKVYDKANTELKNIDVIDLITVFEIPENAYKVVINSGSSSLTVSEVNIRQTEFNNTVTNPIIELNDLNWTTSKTIIITYPEGNYTNEYSLDLGETWQEYLSPITVEKETTVLTRSIENGKVVSSSSFTITKIDNTDPTIELEIPEEITFGDDYNLPTNYSVDETKSGGSAVCKIGEIEVTNTKELKVGTYEIICTVTTGTQKKNSITKIINVIEAVSSNNTQNEDTENITDNDSNIEVGETNE